MEAFVRLWDAGSMDRVCRGTKSGVVEVSLFKVPMELAVEFGDDSVLAAVFTYEQCDEGCATSSTVESLGSGIAHLMSMIISTMPSL